MEIQRLFNILLVLCEIRHDFGTNPTFQEMKVPPPLNLLFKLPLQAPVLFLSAILMLKSREAGSFVVRDSNSFPGAFGLAVKVNQVPHSQTNTRIGISVDESKPKMYYFQGNKAIVIHDQPWK